MVPVDSSGGLVAPNLCYACNNWGYAYACWQNMWICLCITPNTNWRNTNSMCVCSCIWQNNSEIASCSLMKTGPRTGNTQRPRELSALQIKKIHASRWHTVRKNPHQMYKTCAANWHNKTREAHELQAAQMTNETFPGDIKKVMNPTVTPLLFSALNFKSCKLFNTSSCGNACCHLQQDTAVLLSACVCICVVCMCACVFLSCSVLSSHSHCRSGQYKHTPHQTSAQFTCSWVEMDEIDAIPVDTWTWKPWVCLW